MQIRLRLDWCKGKDCGICVAFCPKGVLGISEDTGKVFVKDGDKCTGCGSCELYCPDFCVELVDDKDMIII